MAVSVLVLDTYSQALCDYALPLLGRLMGLLSQPSKFVVFGILLIIRMFSASISLSKYP